MKKSAYDNIFVYAKKTAKETDSWSEERRQQANATIQAIESTYTDQKYLAKKRNYFEKKKK